MHTQAPSVATPIRNVFVIWVKKKSFQSNNQKKATMPAKCKLAPPRSPLLTASVSVQGNTFKRLETYPCGRKLHKTTPLRLLSY